MKLLVLTTEPLPLPNLPTTGAGMRAWGLGFGLRSAGFPDTHIAFAADSVRGREVNTDVVPGIHTFERAQLPALLDHLRPDAIVVQHWGLMRDLPAVSCPLAIDLAGPHLLERRLWGSQDPDADFQEKLKALARADYVVCSGRFQRHYFLPFLFQAGFEASSALCPVIPFSVSPDIPMPSPGRDPSTFVFSGFFLPWQDPSNAIRWTLETIEEKQKCRLLVIGGPHPGGDVSGGRYQQLVERLDSSPFVERISVLPFDQLLGRFLNAGAAIDLMPRNPERELAYPTRTVVQMWAGLPVIHNDYDELSEPIRRSRGGWTLDPGDEQGFRRLIDRLSGHGEDVLSRSEKAQDFIRKHLTWDRTIEPLAAWCAKPEVRKDKKSARVFIPAPAGEAATPRGKQRRSSRDITYSPPPPVAGPNRLQQVLSPLAFLLAVPIGALLLFVFALAEFARLILRGRSA